MQHLPISIFKDIPSMGVSRLAWPVLSMWNQNFTLLPVAVTINVSWDRQFVTNCGREGGSALVANDAPALLDSLLIWSLLPDVKLMIPACRNHLQIVRIQIHCGSCRDASCACIHNLPFPFCTHACAHGQMLLCSTCAHLPPYSCPGVLAGRVGKRAQKGNVQGEVRSVTGPHA